VGPVLGENFRLEKSEKKSKRPAKWGFCWWPATCTVPAHRQTPVCPAALRPQECPSRDFLAFNPAGLAFWVNGGANANTRPIPTPQLPSKPRTLSSGDESTHCRGAVKLAHQGLLAKIRSIILPFARVAIPFAPKVFLANRPFSVSVQKTQCPTRTWSAPIECMKS